MIAANRRAGATIAFFISRRLPQSGLLPRSLAKSWPSSLAGALRKRSRNHGQYEKFVRFPPMGPVNENGQWLRLSTV